MTQSQWMTKICNFQNPEDKQIVYTAFEEEICLSFKANIMLILFSFWFSGLLQPIFKD